MVVLPAPFGPSRANTSPRSTCRSMPRDGLDVAVGLAESAGPRSRVAHRPSPARRLGRDGPGGSLVPGRPGAPRRHGRPACRRGCRAARRRRTGARSSTKTSTTCRSHPSDVAADVGRDDHVRHRPQRAVGRQRLDREHVERGARDRARCAARRPAPARRPCRPGPRCRSVRSSRHRREGRRVEQAVASASVSGRASSTWSASASARCSRRPRARRRTSRGVAGRAPTSATDMPSASARGARSRGRSGPGRRPRAGRPPSRSRRRVRSSTRAAADRGSTGAGPCANASIAPITHSAIGSSNTPRAFVTSTSLAHELRGTAARPPRPSADWIHRSRARAGPGAGSQARRRATRRGRRLPASAAASASAIGRVPQVDDGRRRPRCPGAGRPPRRPSDHDHGTAVGLTAASGSCNPACSPWKYATPLLARAASTGTPARPSRSAGKSTRPVSGSRSRMPALGEGRRGRRAARCWRREPVARRRPRRRRPRPRR